MVNKASSLSSISFYFTILHRMIASIKFDIGFLKFTLLRNGISDLPHLHFNTYIAAILKLFYTTVSMANEYSYGNFKQKT
jgi:hypothetical protein